ncbi:MAG: TerC family protein [Myxococcota bacterium]|nr:TerC family protein [Myxococcota bacterium]MDW8362046.1 TerC family protein [Myxococcales bacterium]
MLEAFGSTDALVGLLTLTALEIVLGIDNVVFIAILTDRLPPERRRLAYRVGLGAALVMRLALLLTISWVMRLTAPLFALLGHEISGRDLILLVGGIFLIGKAAHEIYAKVEGVGGPRRAGAYASFGLTILQIMALDIVFSLDSVITAVGMVRQVEVMVVAVIVAVIVMIAFAPRIGDFVTRNPSMKILALSFLLLIGVLLVAEGFDQHIDKGYVYFAMGFALAVELVNMRYRKKQAASGEHGSAAQGVSS